MLWPEGVQARRRVYVDTLTFCLEKSKVASIVDAQTVRSVLQSAAGELWREGELRLELVWKILTQQPGMTPADVAPPLFLFKSVESELAVDVRLPVALSSLPKSEQKKLLEAMTVPRDELVAKLTALVDAARAEEDAARAAEARPSAPAISGKSALADAVAAAANAASTPPKGAAPVAAAPAAVRARRKKLALALALVAVVGNGVAAALLLGGRPEAMPLDELSTVVRLTDGKRVGESLVARLADPRLEQASTDEQQKTLARLYEVAQRKGLKAVTLVDASGRTRAVVSELGGQRTIFVAPIQK
jgi:hypothetical protein